MESMSEPGKLEVREARPSSSLSSLSCQLVCLCPRRRPKLERQGELQIFHLPTLNERDGRGLLLNVVNCSEARL